jgi:hypothetical protein
MPAVVWIASVDAQCLPETFNFFPPGKVNRPGAWNESSQTIAGNSNATGELYPIATYGKEAGGDFNETLQLHFQPVHPYLKTAGLSSRCVPVQSANRKKLLADAQAPSASLVTPASYTYKYSIDGKEIASVVNPIPGTTSSLIEIEPWKLNLLNVSSACRVTDISKCTLETIWGLKALQYNRLWAAELVARGTAVACPYHASM